MGHSTSNVVFHGGKEIIQECNDVGWTTPLIRLSSIMN